ncbi:MAG: CD1375 family protein [Bacteroidota bacterium]|nr:CD1375 family protein [Bacteroidota bacterium]
MVELYATLVKSGKRTIDQVPEKFRAEVATLLSK